MQPEWIKAPLGGVYYRYRRVLMLLWNGRITGISGIINGAMARVKGDTQWRLFFVGGLMLGGVVLELSILMFSNQQLLLSYQRRQLLDCLLGLEQF